MAEATAPRRSSRSATCTSSTASRTPSRASTSPSSDRILSIVGRNGMGKTTLCNTIVGLKRARSGSISLAGKEIAGLEPHVIARLGIGYVPQGRRVWRSLTVDEHLRLAAAAATTAAWTIERIYETFPRLAERRTNRGSQLSGGEQQMLAIGAGAARQSAPPRSWTSRPRASRRSSSTSWSRRWSGSARTTTCRSCSSSRTSASPRPSPSMSRSWSTAASTGSCRRASSPPTATCSSGSSASAVTPRSPRRRRGRPSLAETEARVAEVFQVVRGGDGNGAEREPETAGQLPPGQRRCPIAGR